MNDRTSAALEIEIVPSALDANGDGLSDAALFKRGNCSIIDGAAGTKTLVATALGGKQSVAANADYDGDGSSECATVSINKKTLKWSFQERGTSVVEVESFGKPSDYVLTGCNLDATPEKELAVMRGANVLMKHKGAATTTVSLPRLYSGKLRGCGDIDGDGTDELLFRTTSGRGRKMKYNLVALNTSGAVVATESNVGLFDRAYAVDGFGSTSNDIVLTTGSTSRKTLVIRERGATSVAATIPGLRQGLSIGVCRDGAGDYASCLQHADAGGQLVRRMLKSAESINTAIPTDRRLVIDAVNIYGPGLTPLP
ncbi:MAG: hypothetical protein IT290_10645 [Deltaproteobacteria bacterium]|nr:hypothetical protein [Deltaproteobacteria bacterium]